MSEELTEKLIAERAEKGNKGVFLSVMSKVADIEPDNVDKLEK